MYSRCRQLFGPVAGPVRLGLAWLLVALFIMTGCGSGGATPHVTGASPTGEGPSSNTVTPPSNEIGRPSGPNVERLQATVLTPVAVGQGAYRIAVPQGWTVSMPQDTNAAVVTPAGQRQPSVMILPMLPVSDLRYTTLLTSCVGQGYSPFGNVIAQCVTPAIQAQLADSRRAWSPDATLQLLLQTMSQGGAAYGTPSLVPISPTASRFQVSATANSQPLVMTGAIQMLYLQNPLLGPAPGQVGVSSFAFLSACYVPPQQVEQMLPICASMLRSFAPSPAWLNALVQQVMNRYQQEFNILLQMGQSAVVNIGLRGILISQWVARMQAMQVQAYQNVQAASYQISQNWIAALGNNANVQDPNTGHMYTVPDGYRTYCLSQAGVVLGSNGELVPGMGPVNDPCQTILKAW